MSTAVSKSNRSDITFMTVFCIVCTLLNTIGSVIATKTGIPFYLDTPGTFLAAACGGYVPGVIVAFATTLIKAITDPEAMYYNVVGMESSVKKSCLFLQYRYMPWLQVYRILY